MSTQQPPPSSQTLDFAPLHRTAELENIHAQVIQNDGPSQQSASTRKVLVKCMTVIGDGSDRDDSQMNIQQ